MTSPHLKTRSTGALVVDVLIDPLSAAKDLGVLNIAGALPFAPAPAIAPALLDLGDGSYATRICAEHSQDGGGVNNGVSAGEAALRA